MMHPPIVMPASCKMILDRLYEHGFSGYAVGGCIRDSLLGRIPNDWDITTNALPGEVMDIFKDMHIIETGLKHGTVTVMANHEPFEITTFRIDGTYSDGRRPDSVQFTARVEDDLARRDFTVNAMAYNDRDGLIDPFGGLQDLKNKVIRCVGEAERRFSEDALRLLRAVRFSASLGFDIAPDTLTALVGCCGLITSVAKERIFSELKKTVTAPYAAQALRLAPQLLFAAVPELEQLYNVPQNSVYHVYDVWEHTLHALDAAPQDTVIRLAVLFHDVGKAASHTVGKDGRDHFYGHAEISGDIARSALRGLRCDNKTLHDVEKLVRLHDLNFPLRLAKFRRTLAALGYPLFYALIEVAKADSAAHAPTHAAERIAVLNEAAAEAKRLENEGYCLSVKQLAVNGRDALALGIPPQAIGDILERLLDDVVIGQTPNDREILLERLTRMKTQKSKQ